MYGVQVQSTSRQAEKKPNSQLTNDIEIENMIDGATATKIDATAVLAAVSFTDRRDAQIRQRVTKIKLDTIAKRITGEMLGLI